MGVKLMYDIRPFNIIGCGDEPVSAGLYENGRLLVFCYGPPRETDQVLKRVKRALEFDDARYQTDLAAEHYTDAAGDEGAGR